MNKYTPQYVLVCTHKDTLTEVLPKELECTAQVYKRSFLVTELGERGIRNFLNGARCPTNVTVHAYKISTEAAFVISSLKYPTIPATLHVRINERVDGGDTLVADMLAKWTGLQEVSYSSIVDRTRSFSVDLSILSSVIGLVENHPAVIFWSITGPKNRDGEKW